MKNILPACKNFLGLFLLTLLLVSGLVLINPPLATAETEENPSATAVDNFLHSTLDSYRQNTDDSFRNSLKTLQKTVNELSERLEKVADPRTDEETRQQLRETITESQHSLQETAGSFTGLAERAGELDEQIGRSLQEFVERVKTQIHPQLTDSQASFTAITEAIAAIAEDTTRINDGDLRSIMIDLGERIQALNQAIEVGDKVVKAFSS